MSKGTLQKQYNKVYFPRSNLQLSDGQPKKDCVKFELFREEETTSSLCGVPYIFKENTKPGVQRNGKRSALVCS